MIKISTVKSTIVDAGKRIVKILRLGRSDVQTSNESMPFGVDANPLKGMTAIQVETGVKGKTIVIGYVNTEQLAKVGEIRIFAADSTGVKSFVHCKANGNVHVNGEINTAVAFVPLNAVLQKLSVDINANLTAIAASIATPGLPYAPVPVVIDASPAQVQSVKLP